MLFFFIHFIQKSFRILLLRAVSFLSLLIEFLVYLVANQPVKHMLLLLLRD